MSVEVPQVCILGAGPAGLSAALWLHNFGLRVTLLEKTDYAGGMQRLNFLPNDWLLGQPGLAGPELAQRFVAHVTRHVAITLHYGCLPTRIERLGKGFRITGAEGRCFDCAAILLATGTRFRAEETMIRVDGFESHRGVFSFGPHVFRDMERLAGQRVLIIGGGDNAFENARFLLELGCHVTLAARSAIRAQRVLRSRVENAENSRVLCPVYLQKIALSADGVVASLVDQDSRMQALQVDRIHVLAGYEPNTGFLRDCLGAECLARLRFDPAGYLVADGFGRTGCRGLYVAGDVCNPAHPCVVSALAEGAEAARGIEMDLRNA